MTPERWEEVREVLGQVLELAPEQRSQFLERACSNDPSLRSEVESLLSWEGKVRSSLLQSSRIVHLALIADGSDKYSNTVSDDSSMIGKRVAQYRIVSKIGSGGMGDVYRAVRADDVFQQLVAIKLVRTEHLSSPIVSRVQAERQILAALNHPNIARLLDGGTTNDGNPFLVMELIEGKPIDKYCSDQSLTVEERLRLFLEICSAVQYAHQFLVVHRDLKPSNILIDSDGVPKLLDFGIAKILLPETGDVVSSSNTTGAPALTPAYASPEQLTGAPISTATDVYLLGILLYELLAGEHPFYKPGVTLHEIARAVCEFEPEKPSSVVRRSENHGDFKIASLSMIKLPPSGKLSQRLRGDLDTIVLTALQKEPARRYPSVDRLADDVRRHLNRLPIQARKVTALYRSSKFVLRHRLGTAASITAALLLVLAVVLIAREAHIARIEQARAERRFNDVRKLANSLLFDIHDAIRDLPGSTSARKMLVTNALIYLDSLAEEARGDLSLQRELAEAYERVGDVQGNPRFANVGDTAGAIESYRKALRLRLALADDRRSTPADRINLAAIYEKLGFTLGATNDFAAELATLQGAYPVVGRLEAEQKDNPDAQEIVAEVYLAMGQCLSDMGNLAGALEYYRRSAATREAITGGSSAFRAQEQMYLAGLYDYMGEVKYLQGNVDEALLLQTKARDTMAQLVKSDPQNATFEQFLSQAEFGVGYYLSRKGLNRQALHHYQIALAGYRKLTSSDPHDMIGMRYFARCYMRIGLALAAEGEPAQGVQSVRKSLQIFEGLWATDYTDTYYKASDVAYARSALGETYSRLGMQPSAPEALKVANWREARAWYEKSLDTWALLQRQAPLARWDSEQPDKIRGEIRKCDTVLAALQSAQ